MPEKERQAPRQPVEKQIPDKQDVREYQRAVGDELREQNVGGPRPSPSPTPPTESGPINKAFGNEGVGDSHVEGVRQYESKPEQREERAPREGNNSPQDRRDGK